MKKKETDIKKPKNSQFSSHLTHGITEGALIGLVALCVYMMLALLGYNSHDPGWSYTGDVTNTLVANSAGRAGAWLSDVLFILLGYMAFLLPIMLAYRAWMIFWNNRNAHPWNWPLFGLQFVGFVMVMLAGTALATMHFNHYQLALPESSGGVLGQVIFALLLPSFSYAGTTLILLTFFLIGITVFTGLSWLKLMDFIGKVVLSCSAVLIRVTYKIYNYLQEKYASKQINNVSTNPIIPSVATKIEPTVSVAATVIKPYKPDPIIEHTSKEEFLNDEIEHSLPSLSILDKPDFTQQAGYSSEELDSMSRLLEFKLKDFGVVAKVVDVQPGPVITRFEIQPAPGVKVSKISNLVKDLARSLAVISVRVVEVIPGKPVVGIEIPNEQRQMVQLSEILSSNEYLSHPSPLVMALGHGIGGKPVVADLAKMPHLLVAGTTGSGKSVALNAMLLSFLFKATPEDVRLIMIDPKMLELSVYDGIPHLLAPVITDMKEAANGLRWCVAEMERRYKLMATMGVRNLEGCNRKIKQAIKDGEPLKDPLWVIPDGVENKQAPELSTLPYIVVVVDEFADMMMIVGKKVEELIARIAQKARAAGIHLILATQRPSVDVITGLIKANIPTRIGLQVSSRIDSRTILDQGGAEQLLGHGDMLYLPPGAGVPIRVHGAFVADEEVHRVVKDWAKRAKPKYIDAVLAGPADNLSTAEVADAEQDVLYDQAVQFVLESRRASISSVQRKLKIGYNRAARIIESMELAGLITAMNTNGSREILVPPSVE